MEDEGYPMPQPMQFGHTTEGSLQYQIEVDEIIRDIERTLKGQSLQFDEKAQGYIYKKTPFARALINQKGINSLMVILKSRLTKIFVLSDFEDDDISKVAISVGQDIIDDFYYNWQEYGVKDTAAASLILHLITDTVHATLRKAKRGNYLKFLSTVQTISEMQHKATSMRPEPRSDDSGILNTLFKRRR